MRVSRITLREIRLPLQEAFRISSGAVRERRIMLLALECADGVMAWSECVAGEWPNYSAETIDTAWHAIREWLAPRVLGVELAEARGVHDMLGRDVRGHAMAKAALEMGVWALEAEMRGRPLARLLGGTRDRVAVGISLGLQDSAGALVERALAAADRGYRRIKLKIAPGADVENVRIVRAALPDADLSVDANAAYERGDAGRLMLLDAFGLVMIEQPLEPDDLLGHAELQATLRTPICLDESITAAARVSDMVRLGSGRIVNIKPGRVGGFTSSLRIHDLCTERGVPVWCGGMLESGIGRAHNVALASLPNFTLPGDLSPSARYWERDIVRPEWTMDASGHVRVPDAPGLGVEVDVDRVDDLTVRCEELGAD
jgi:O-succinylbenzoate synthase